MSLHRKHFLARPNSSHIQSRRGRTWIWVLLSMFVLGGIALFGLVIAIGVSSPETSVYPGSEVPASYLKTARNLGALGPNEKPKFFYSDGLMGIKSGFYLVTDTKLAIYCEDGRETPLTVLEFKDIATADLSRDESFFEDSRISIETKSGEFYSVPVSSEFDRDKLFFEVIRTRVDAR